ncbi:hypothetical protein HPB47_015467 [Ixodes persulcatus]|uniref:Uncharacterized protein n=1 Tax=Ixodes persulcatus TaxID=34615 RepID=A0AC60QX03_IXOPE|nr:hypothetical protein HPB47_015467 [Ixodes persulcatus]
MSWDRVKSEVIANCLMKWGFFGAQGDTPSIEEDNGGLQILDWDQLNVDVSPEEFVSADDQLAICELRTLQGIIAEAISATVEDDDDDEDDDTQGLGDDCGDRCAQGARYMPLVCGFNFSLSAAAPRGDPPGFVSI